MEFERSIFRMHERILLGKKRLVSYLKRCTCTIFLYLFIGFVIYHKSYVNNGAILTTQIEDQLLSSKNIKPEYQHLTYIENTDTFVFCEKNTLKSNDTEALSQEAMERLNDTQIQV